MTLTETITPSPESPITPATPPPLSEPIKKRQSKAKKCNRARAREIARLITLDQSGEARVSHFS